MATSLETPWKERYGTTAVATGQLRLKEETMNINSIRARRALRKLVIHMTLAATTGAAEALTVWVLSR